MESRAPRLEILAPPQITFYVCLLFLLKVSELFQKINKQNSQLEEYLIVF